MAAMPPAGRMAAEDTSRKDRAGKPIPTGVALRPFREKGWYWTSLSHAARIVGVATALRHELKLADWVEFPARLIDLSGVYSSLSAAEFESARGEDRGRRRDAGTRRWPPRTPRCPARL